MSDFREFAMGVARRAGAEGMLPVVEKELVHYDVLRALDRSGWLDRLVFQGGTCLRLCHGAARYSEDLDFSTGEDLSEVDLAGFREAVAETLGRRYGVDVRVKAPKRLGQLEGGGALKRWQVVVDTAPERPDLPSQRVKVEIAQVPSYTREVRLLVERYPELGGAYARTLVACESLGEILADKLVSFSRSARVARYRDLWDIPWILSRPGVDADAAARMARAKFDDYGGARPAPELLREGLSRAGRLTEERAFAEQMSRFLPPDVRQQTVDDPAYRQAMARATREMFERALDAP